MLPAIGVALKVNRVGFRRGQFTALVTLCLRALPLAEWRTEHGTLTNLYQTPIFTNIRMSNVLGVKR